MAFSLCENARSKRRRRLLLVEDHELKRAWEEKAPSIKAKIELYEYDEAANELKELLL